MNTPRSRPSLAVAGRSLALAEVVSFLAPLVVLQHVTRTLGAEGYGRVQTVLTIGAFAGLVANPGLAAVATRRSARLPGGVPRLFSRLHPWRLAGGALAAAFLVTLPIALSWSPEMTRLLWIDALLVLAQSASTDAYLVGAGDGAWVGHVRTGSTLAYAAAVLLVVRDPTDTAALLWVGVASTATIALLHALRFRRRHGALALAPSWRTGRPILKEASGFGLSSVMSLVYARIDVLLLRGLRGEADVGRYAACVRVTEATYAALTVLQGTLYPRSITEGRRSPRRASAQAQRALRIALGLALPSAAGAIVAGGPVVAWIAGPAFAGLDLTTALLGVVAVAGAFASIYGAFGLAAHGRSGLLLRATTLGALVNVAANLALIPAMGIAGAAVTTFLAQATVAWAAAARSRDVLRLDPLRAARPWLLPCLALATAVLAARLLGAPAWCLVLLGVAVYAGAVAALGTLRPSERRGLRRAMRRG